MRIDPIFDRCFCPLVGSVCWNVKPGHGSFLTLEFGEPHLEVREPRAAAENTSPKVRELMARRQVTVRGDWHFWVYCCDWTVFDGEYEIGSSSDNESYHEAAAMLDGQALSSFTFDATDSTSAFAFDLGASLRIMPYDDNSEQWMLYQPDNYVLTLRADGLFSYQKSNTKPEAQIWQPAWTP